MHLHSWEKKNDAAVTSSRSLDLTALLSAHDELGVFIFVEEESGLIAPLVKVID